MKTLRVLITALVVGGALATFYFISRDNEVCTTAYRADKLIYVRDRIISAEIVDTPSEQQQGLSGRSCISRHQAMLFVNDKPGRYSIWMKDMRFPIDILWLGPDKKVVKLLSNVSPDTYPQTFVNEQPAQYVLEVAAGEAGKLGLDIGDQLTF